MAQGLRNSPVSHCCVLLKFANCNVLTTGMDCSFPLLPPSSALVLFRQQHDTERSVLETIQKNMKNPTIVDLDSSSPGASELPVLLREKHISFLLEGLEQ